MLIRDSIIYRGVGGGKHAHNPNPNSQECIIAKQQYNILDYVGRIGSLARILSKYYDIDVLVYEEYMSEFKNDCLVNYIQRDKLGKYDAVINSAMFEHITKREHLDHINSLVI